MIEQLIIAEAGITYLVVGGDLRVRAVGGRADLLVPAPAAGEHLLEILPELVGHEETLAAVIDGRLARLRLPEINRGEGAGVRYFELVSLPAPGDGGGLLQIVADVTERGVVEQARVQQRNELHLLKQRITRQHIELARSNAELRRATQLKDEFLAGMSHEVRTPLTAILGMAELLRAQLVGPLSGEQVQALRGIEESGRHLLALINDFLDLAKIEAGQLELDEAEVSLRWVIEASLRIVGELAVRKGIALSTRYDPQVVIISADERRLRQALINLLSNAVKFTRAGGAGGVEVRGDPAHGLVRITVWDTGIGIAAEDLARLFRPFAQIDSPLQRESAGSGLGLVMVAQLAQLHGGSVAVESEPGRGSRFTITLPWSPAAQARALPELAPATPLPEPVITPAPGEPGAALVLLVEDDPATAGMLAELLRRSGYRVVHARSGDEALACVAEELPQLVLMDLRMRGMDGLETIRRMRALVTMRDTPIVALTALAVPGDRERCLAAGATAYLCKPVPIGELTAAAADLVRAADPLGARRDAS